MKFEYYTHFIRSKKYVWCEHMEITCTKKWIMEFLIIVVYSGKFKIYLLEVLEANKDRFTCELWELCGLIFVHW